MFVLDERHTRAASGPGYGIDGVLEVVIMCEDDLCSLDGGDPRLVVGVGEGLELCVDTCGD